MAVIFNNYARFCDFGYRYLCFKFLKHKDICCELEQKIKKLKISNNLDCTQRKLILLT